MPRKNCNARSVDRPKESWVSLLPYDGRIKVRSNKKTIGRGGDGEMGRNYTTIKTTAESIVREFRKSSELKPEFTFQPYRRLPQPQSSPIEKIFNRINWPRVFDTVCMGLVILAIAAISGVMFFGPISWREFIR